MSDLKPCLFCGGKVYMESDNVDYYSKYYSFHCDACDMVSYYDRCNCEEEAIEAWNRRAGEEDKHEGD